MAVRERLDAPRSSPRDDLDRYLVNPPGKLTYKLIKRFCKLIDRDAIPFDAACDYLGISPSLFWSWMKAGNQYNDALGASGGADPKHRIYGDFVNSLKKAFALYRMRVTEGLHDPDAGRDWVKFMTILERRDRPNYSRQDQGMGSLDEYDPDERFL